MNLSALCNAIKKILDQISSHFPFKFSFKGRLSNRNYCMLFLGLFASVLNSSSYRIKPKSF